MRRLITTIVSFRAVAVLLAATLTLTVTSPASAQFARAAGIVDISQPEYLSRDLVIFVDGLDLDEAQRVIVESVYEQYVRDFQAGWDGLQDEITEVSKSADRDRMDNRALLGLILEPFQSWREERSALGEQFLQNVQLILNEQQAAGWDDFLRRLRREKLMRKGMFSGEDLDLIAVLRDMHLDDTIMFQIEPVVDAYAIEIGEALERREAALEARSRDLIGMLVDEDADEAVRVVKEHVELRKAIRGVNDRYIEDIAAALGDELGPQFRERALRKGYPSVFQKTQADRMFEAALQLDGLDSSTIEAILSIRDMYEARADQINNQIFTALREFEPATEIARAERYAAHVKNQATTSTPNTTYPLFRERTAIVQEHIFMLKDVMPLELFAELPGSGRYMKKEIDDTQQRIDQLEREREKMLNFESQKAYQKAKDMITGNQAAKAARQRAEQEKKNKGDDN